MINKPKFYNKARGSLFANRLRQGQVNGLEAILQAGIAGLGGSVVATRQLAYCLATAYHECDKEMQPIIEYGHHAYFNKYEPGTRVGKNLGNTQPGDGYKYRGRCFVQLTGRANYARAGKELAIDLTDRPDDVLFMDVATKILITGMKEGWFTAKRLSQYINDSKTDYVGAHRIINGTDRAGLIAGYANKFLMALS